MTMLKSDFNYELPEELIAQTPVEPRDSSRLMAIDRSTGEISHRHFYDIADYLNPGDLLVMNDSKVFPARIYGVKRGTGAHVEFAAQASEPHRMGDPGAPRKASETRHDRRFPGGAFR